MEKYLNILKALVEGKMNLTDWRNWWHKNASQIETEVSRLRFLRLKHQPLRHARNLLDEFGVDYQPDESRCEVCGETLFVAVPGETTTEEIVEFARSAAFPGAEIIERERWIHPGAYCQNGCTIILTNHGSGDLWERLKQDFERTHTCPVTVSGDTTLLHPFSAYNVYVDGNIDRTRPEDFQPENGEFVWLLPGDHRIVVRESDVKKVNRLESNTLWFTASEGIALHFEVGMLDGHLKLIQHHSWSQ